MLNTPVVRYFFISVILIILVTVAYTFGGKIINKLYSDEEYYDSHNEIETIEHLYSIKFPKAKG